MFVGPFASRVFKCGNDGVALGACFPDNVGIMENNQTQLFPKGARLSLGMLHG